MKRAPATGIMRLALLAAIVVAVASLGLGRADRAQAQTGGDVAVTIAASKHAVKAGSNITFTITATNVASEPAQNVVVSGWLPDWFNFVASRCSSETAPVFQVGALACAVGYAPDQPVDLLPRQSVTLTLVLTTFNNPKQDRNNAYELGFVTWGPDPANPAFENQARVNVQIAGKPAK